MTRWMRAVLAAVAVAAGLVMALPTGASAQGGGAATGAPKTASGDPAIDDLVGCVQGSRQLLVLFLIDESASLKQTDPSNERVDAARSALESLMTLATAEGQASPEVQVAMAAFSNDYRLVQDWTPADASTRADLRSSLDRFASYHDGIDTDFVNALSAGREALADQSAKVTASGGEAPCRAILLFTDGGFDIAVRASKADQDRLGTTKPYAPGISLTTKASVAKAEAAGRRALCRPEGLADRLRNDDVTLITVALSEHVARRAQLPLAAATVGKADDYVCGSETSRPRGSYLPADGIDVLVTRFNEVGTRLAGGNQLTFKAGAKMCGPDACEEGTRTFGLDATLRRAQVLALPPSPGATVELQGPTGDPQRFTKAGEATVSGADVTVRQIAGRGLTLDIRRGTDATGWKGDWKVSLLDPSGKSAGDGAVLEVFVFSDIGIRLGGGLSLTRGEPTKVSAVLQAPKGTDVGTVVAKTNVQARFRNPIDDHLDTVELTGPPGGPFTGTYTPATDVTANAMEVVVEGRITTAAGASLLSQSAVSEQLVRRPGDAVQFAPASLKLPSLKGHGVTETSLVLVGGKTEGCVWFGKTSVPEAPDGAGPIVLTADDGPLPAEPSCIKVPAGGQVTVNLQAAVKGRKGSGAVNGTVEVFERTKGTTTATTTQVPFRFDLARQVDQARRLMLALLLLAVGLGIPMLALLIINALTARFQTLDAVRGSSLRVLVSDLGVQRIDGAYPKRLVLRPADFGTLADAGNHRRFTFGGIDFRAQASRNPFGSTIAMAAPEGGAEKLKGNAGSRVELDPALAGSWVFLLDADATRRRQRGESEGQLISFVAEGDVDAQVNRMLPDITKRLPTIASRLSGLVREKKVDPAKAAKRRAKAARAEADRAEADRAEADRAEADRAEADRAEGAVGDPPAPEPSPPAEPAADHAASPAEASGDDTASRDGGSDDRDPPTAPLGFTGGPRS